MIFRIIYTAYSWENGNTRNICDFGQNHDLTCDGPHIKISDYKKEMQIEFNHLVNASLQWYFHIFYKYDFHHESSLYIS